MNVYRVSLNTRLSPLEPIQQQTRLSQKRGESISYRFPQQGVKGRALRMGWQSGK